MNDLLKMGASLKDDSLVIRKGIENSIAPVCSLKALQMVIKSVVRLNWGLSQNLSIGIGGSEFVLLHCLPFLCKSLFNKTVFFV